MTKVSSLPLLGLESFHECLDRYSAKGQMGKTSGVWATVCPKESQPNSLQPTTGNFDCFYPIQGLASKTFSTN